MGIAVTTVSLNSGSNGNSTIVRTRNTTLLVDAGLNGKQTRLRMEAAGIDISDIDAIIITHEHSDHIAGAGVLARRLKVPVYMTELTAFFAEMKIGEIPKLELFGANDALEIGDFHIEPFSISHDAADPVGFHLSADGIRIGICTDLGVIPHYIREILHDVNILFIESNHDLDMLLHGSYPMMLKKRIHGNLGHLSNEDAARALLDIIGEHTDHIFLSHLSRDNNTPQKAYHTVRRTLREFHLNPAMHLTRRDGISEVIGSL